MKKKIAVIVSAVHLALWVALMVLCAAAWIVYDGSGEEPIGCSSQNIPFQSLGSS